MTSLNTAVAQIEEDPVPAHAKKVKKKKKVGKAGNIHCRPTNLQECRDCFFASGFKENPQFKYKDAKAAANSLKLWAAPNGEYLKIAEQIMDTLLNDYGCESRYLDC